MQKKPKIPLELRIALGILTLSISLVLSGCSHERTIPAWQGKLYAGDSKSEGIARSQSGEQIACASDTIDSYLCMTYQDFEEFYSIYVLGCSDWKKEIPTTSARKLWESYRLELERARK